MLRYFLRRILLAVPTLLVISMAVFGLSKCAPYDSSLDLGEGAVGDLRQQEAAVRSRAAQLGLDKPTFYFTLTTAAFPDTLHRIFPLSRREQLKFLCAQTGNWLVVSRYDATLHDVIAAADDLPDTLAAVGDFRVVLSELTQSENIDLMAGIMGRLRTSSAILPADMQLHSLLDTLNVRVADLHTLAQPSQMKVPALHWHGFDNQYHHWLSGFVRGDLGMSRSHKTVWGTLKFSLLSTMIINGVAIMVAYLIAVPLGVAMARRRERLFDRASRWVLLFLYAMPLFWLGSLLIQLFATPNLGLYLINGINLESYQGSGKTYTAWCVSNADKFVLPILTLSLHALAILALQMRGGMLDALSQDFIRTARAKGVSENAVYWRHAFRNALFPIITVFASVFPAIFTGSLVVEYLFGFPGLGMKTQEAYMVRDYPVLFAILMLAATLTIVGNLIADLLYAWADPRVRFAKE